MGVTPFLSYLDRFILSARIPKRFLQFGVVSEGSAFSINPKATQVTPPAFRNASCYPPRDHTSKPE